MKNRFGILPGVVLVAAFLTFSSQTSRAALNASDNASNSAYDDEWTTGDNGGSGFQAWNLTANATAGFFIGNSTSLGGGSDINVSGESFGMYANGMGNPNANAERNFTSGQLADGQQFTFLLAVNYRNGGKGFVLNDSGGNALWSFDVSNNEYRINGSSIFANEYNANTIFSFTFSQNADSLDYSVTRSGGLSGTVTGNSANIDSGMINGIRFYIYGTETGDENNLYFNSLAVVPEPTTIALGIFGGLALAGLVIRRVHSRSSFKLQPSSVTPAL